MDLLTYVSTKRLHERFCFNVATFAFFKVTQRSRSAITVSQIAVLKIMARTAHDNTFLIKISTLSLARRLIEKEKA